MLKHINNKALTILIICILSWGNNYAATNKIDSLKNSLKSTTTDRSTISIYNQISTEYLRINPDSCLAYATKAYDLSIKKSHDKGLGIALNNIGNYLITQSRFGESRIKFNNAIEIGKKINNKTISANALNSIGISYAIPGLNIRALKYFLESLELRLEIGNKVKISASYNNLGEIYNYLGNYNKALEYYKKGLILKGNTNEETDNVIIANIGTIYFKQGKLVDALSNHLKAITVATKMKDKQVISESSNYTGMIYIELNKLDSALFFISKARDIAKEFGDKHMMISTSISLAKVKIGLGQHNEALELLDDALNKSKKMPYLSGIKNSYKQLAKAHKALNNINSAFEYQTLYTQITDSINEAVNKEKVLEIENNYISERKKRENELKEIEIKNNQIKNQTIQYFILLIVFFTIIFSYIIFKKYKREKVISQTIEEQKKVIEVKNRKITDNIVYAKNIQNSIMPDINVIKKHFPNSFIYFKPKDIVSGDFFWFNHTDGISTIAAIDCTGHGVTGAFMSLIGNAILTEIINKAKGKENAGYILTQMDTQLKSKLTNEIGASIANHGMDISLCIFNHKTNALDFAGAIHPIYIIKNEDLYVLMPDKISLGSMIKKQEIKYNSKRVILEKGDTIYLFTDGLIDQFGGPNKKKFNISPFKNLLKSVNNLNSEQQIIKIDDSIQAWKGETEQVDDILIIGLQV